jgi:hypothetical protein
VDGIGVIALTVGLMTALSPKGNPTLEDPTMRRLGWVLVAVSFLLLVAGTLAPPLLANDQAPTAPSGPAPDYPEKHTVPTPM